ncbi:hypothetical protein [Amycolatopsis thailandensis]|uniref:hypothetical protein n=1 Tax=Amycolatopsis thailandensis TaxID=589330 RepID=UPI001ABF526C|nr:hypothetical protein [Amycolatopsis thailandensis]
MTDPVTQIDVLIADDDPVVRFGLKMMLGGAPDLRVVAEAGDGSEAVELARRHGPRPRLCSCTMLRPARD